MNDEAELGSVVQVLRGESREHAIRTMLSILKHPHVISSKWIEENGVTLAPIVPNLRHSKFAPAASIINAMASRFHGDVLYTASHMEVFGEYEYTYYTDSVLEAFEGTDAAKPLVVSMNCNEESLKILFDDAFYTHGCVCYPAHHPIVLLRAELQECNAIAGPQDILEECLGQTVEEAWGEWDEKLADDMNYPEESNYKYNQQAAPEYEKVRR